MAFQTGVDVISSSSFIPWKLMDGNAPVTQLAGIWTLNSYMQDRRFRFVSDRYTRKDPEISQEILFSRRSGNNWPVGGCTPTWLFRSRVLIFLEYPRIEQQIMEGEAKRNKRSNLGSLLLKKISSLKYPIQELELNYPTTKGKIYSEEDTDASSSVSTSPVWLPTPYTNALRRISRSSRFASTGFKSRSLKTEHSRGGRRHHCCDAKQVNKLSNDSIA
jgi:hypothetical protein